VGKHLTREFVEAVHRDYVAGMTLAAAGRKYGHDRRTLRDCFARFGLKIRPLHYEIIRGRHGQIAPVKPKTDREINELVAKAPRMAVPGPLRVEWRHWSMSRRMWLIGKLRNRFPSTRPKGAYSSNVVPFDYGTPAPREIMESMNEGTNSRTKRCQLRPISEGVIFEGRLWFWVSQHKNRGNMQGDGYFIGTWKPGRGRPCLHHELWERTHGRKVPEGYTVVHADGNKNNLEPSNLVLRSRADCARQNIVIWRMKRSREQTAALLKLATQPGRKGNGNINRIVREGRYKRGFSAGSAVVA
jgi:hypothetical protein